MTTDGSSSGNGQNGHGPAHGRRDRRRRRYGRLDRRALAMRLPVVVALGAAAVAGVAFDGADEDTTRRTGGADTAAVSASAAMPQSPPAARGASTWYCAAGTSVADGLADHSVALQNAGDDHADVTLTIYGGDLPGGSAPAPAPVVDEIRVPAGRTTEIRLGDRVDTPLSSALVEVSGGDVAVEHRVEGPHGADTGPCATFAASTWHLAWASTARDARELVVLFNPFPTGAVVDARFATDEGPREPVRYQGLPVPPESVVALDVGDDVSGADQLSATIDVRSGRVVAERLQVFDGSYGVEGLTLGLGLPAAEELWVFADGEASSASLGAPDPSTGERPRADEEEEDESGDAASEASGDDASDDADGSDDGSDTDGTGDDAVDAASDESSGGSGDDDAEDPRDDGDATVTTERIVVYNPGDERAEVDVTVVPFAGGQDDTSDGTVGAEPGSEDDTGSDAESDADASGDPAGVGQQTSSESGDGSGTGARLESGDEPAGEGEPGSEAEGETGDAVDVPSAVVPTPPPFSLSIGPGRFAVVDYGAHDRVVPGIAHATIVESTNGQPVVAERVTLDEGPESDDAEAVDGSDDDGDESGEGAAGAGSLRPGEVTVAPGALTAATTWRLPLGASPTGEESRTEVVVFNPDADRVAEVRLDPATAAAGDPAYEVAPGERLAIPLDSAHRVGVEVVSDVPVLVERVVRTEDARRVAAGPAVPSADGATPL